MNDDLLRTFDTLPKADLSEIDDANDNVPLTHKGGTVDQTDLGITPNFLNCITVLKCDTAANVAKKECTYVGGMPLNGAAEECIGRTIMVIFTNENSVDNPSISYNKLLGPIVLLNQAADVTVGKNCFGKNTRELFTWDGTAFVMHSNIASNDNASTGLTRFSNGTDVYNKQSVDSALTKLSPLTMQHSEDANSCIPTNSNNVQTFILPAGSVNCPVLPCSITTYKRNTDRYEQVCFPSGINESLYYRYGTTNNGATTWGNWTKVATSSDLTNYEVKNEKIIKLKNNFNYPICYKLCTVSTTSMFNCLYISTRVNGFQKIKGTAIIGTTVSNSLGYASTINEWNTYFIVDSNYNVYIVIASFSEVSIIPTFMGTITPTWIGNIPSYVAHD